MYTKSQIWRPHITRAACMSWLVSHNFNVENQQTLQVTHTIWQECQQDKCYRIKMTHKESFKSWSNVHFWISCQWGSSTNDVTYKKRKKKQMHWSSLLFFNFADFCSGNFITRVRIIASINRKSEFKLYSQTRL